MIQPGLERISKLLARTALPWRAIHVAGTNGKGSVCNYISSMLDVYTRSGQRHLSKHPELSWGRFTSPHLVDRWDGIVINGETISKTTFESIEEELLDYNREQAIGASQFEILTATAFRAFNEAKVDIGIVEVGMGGTLDATNILGSSTDIPQYKGPIEYRAKPLVTAITKIGLDHQGFLGTSLVEIAAHKAGIMKPGVPVVFDESNKPQVKAVIKKQASAMGVKPTSLKQLGSIADMLDWRYLPGKSDEKKLVPIHTQHNNSVALCSTVLALQQLDRLEVQASEFALHDLLQEMSAVVRLGTSNPGRLERLILDHILGFDQDETKFLLDGAHNEDSAGVLAEEVARLRLEPGYGTHITWILAASQGRDVKALLQPFLQPGDSVFAVEFGPVDNMPWIKPVKAADVLAVAAEILGDSAGHMENCGTDVQDALDRAPSCPPVPHWTVVAGSLYLVGDTHRLMRAKANPRPDYSLLYS